ncbi:MAG TPA: hypothetical protein PK867_15665 [Pirellulales bacterium]|nr:hypothetical protein [Pirellulales bacterium]
MQIERINLVVTCTKRKRLPVPRELRLGSAVAPSVKRTARCWLNRLATNTSPCVAAEDLYAGDQWSIARSLPAVAAKNGSQVSLWVCSAGYGLIPASAGVHAYSATFSSNHPDGVGACMRGAREGLLADWWELLAAWQGPAPGEPRTLGELARRNSSSPLLVVASAAYVAAMRRDLEQASRCLDNPKSLTIVSAGSNRTGALAPHFLPCDARLRSLLGGSLMSLNARVARRLLLRYPATSLRCDELSVEFERLLRREPRPAPLDRRPLTDDQAKRFIRQCLKSNPSARYTPSLRLLRKRGWACEQKRFRALFAEERESGNGQ